MSDTLEMISSIVTADPLLPVDIVVIRLVASCWRGVAVRAQDLRTHHQAFNTSLKNVRIHWSHECTRNRVNVFETGIKLPGRSEASLAATTPCQLQLPTVLGSRASKLCGDYCMLHSNTSVHKHVVVVYFAWLNVTVRSRIILDTLMVIDLIKKLCVFYGTRRFVTVFTKAHNDKFSRARKSSLRFNIILRCIT
jgi:hypothetical protein